MPTASNVSVGLLARASEFADQLREWIYLATLAMAVITLWACAWSDSLRAEACLPQPASCPSAAPGVADGPRPAARAVLADGRDAGF